jgi:hypothetical protein
MLGGRYDVVETPTLEPVLQIAGADAPDDPPQSAYGSDVLAGIVDRGSEIASDTIRSQVNDFLQSGTAEVANELGVGDIAGLLTNQAPTGSDAVAASLVKQFAGPGLDSISNDLSVGIEGAIFGSSEKTGFIGDAIVRQAVGSAEEAATNAITTRLSTALQSVQGGSENQDATSTAANPLGLLPALLSPTIVGKAKLLYNYLNNLVDVSMNSFAQQVGFITDSPAPPTP